MRRQPQQETRVRIAKSRAGMLGSLGSSSSLLGSLAPKRVNIHPREQHFHPGFLVSHCGSNAAANMIIAHSPPTHDATVGVNSARDGCLAWGSVLLDLDDALFRTTSRPRRHPSDQLPAFFDPPLPNLATRDPRSTREGDRVFLYYQTVQSRRPAERRPAVLASHAAPSRGGAVPELHDASAIQAFGHAIWAWSWSSLSSLPA